MKVVIVGGVAGGATAAARIRRLDEKAEILIFERSGYISYANCGLPYYIGGVIPRREDLTLQTPRSFYDRFRIQVKVRHEVTALHPEEKMVTVKNLETGEEFRESYDKLLLAPGAKPLKPPFEGNDLEQVFTLRTVEDTFKIHDYIQSHHPKSAVLAGGGFIGLEMAENLRELGMEVTIVQRGSQLMPPFDQDMAAYIQAEMRRHGVNLALDRSVEGLRPREGGVEVLLKDAPSLYGDMVILAMGVTPDSKLAREAGLALGMRDSILVNDRMETSQPDIYAVGDAVQVKHFVTGEDALIALAGPANRQARIAGDNICGGDSRYTGSQGSSILKVFDLTAAATGLNQRAASRLYDTERVILSPMNHAGYYPGGRNMTLKVVFDRESHKVLGAQIVGYDGVDKRIDVIATAIRAGMKIQDLAELDLAYAPPYSSAKDPVNMAGFIGENLIQGIVKQWGLEALPALMDNPGVTLVDTRTPGEYAGGHIPGFVNIPVDELRQRLGEIPEGKPVYLICQSGLRSYLASRILAGLGWEVYNFPGGYGYYETVTRERCLVEQSLPCGMEKPQE